MSVNSSTMARKKGRLERWSVGETLALAIGECSPAFLESCAFVLFQDFSATHRSLINNRSPWIRVDVVTYWSALKNNPADSARISLYMQPKWSEIWAPEETSMLKSPGHNLSGNQRRWFESTRARSHGKQPSVVPWAFAMWSANNNDWAGFWRPSCCKKVEVPSTTRIFCKFCSMRLLTFHPPESVPKQLTFWKGDWHRKHVRVRNFRASLARSKLQRRAFRRSILFCDHLLWWKKFLPQWHGGLCSLTVIGRGRIFCSCSRTISVRWVSAAFLQMRGFKRFDPVGC